ncbi:hypothetical protein EV196_11095 [Mariniflexile fucanivorans]|uniref:6-bladed beta-propeller protein n=1 Tax=Mariniflexile fucanivorans TaxID=264023 RepID=A0A4R1RCF4_9FLAO|nr:hypothetical protein [Mariniflexile fucanivorans]TCL63142.1 hypothetical protein EV196_11095 [Mariniflexile fucanivorans]
MKKILVLLACFVLAIGYSQNKTTLKVLESAEFEDEVRSEQVLSMHTSESGLIGVIRNSKNHLLFDVFNESLGRIKNIQIEKDRNESYSGDLSFNNIIKVFTVLSPSKKERVLFCHEFNISDGSHKKTELFKAEVEKNQPIFSGANKRQTGLAMSPNGDYFVVSTDDIKKNSNSYTVRVYNTNDLSLVYTKKYQENIDKFFELNDLFIDDFANVFTIGKLFLDGRSQKKGGKANYDFVVNKLTASTYKTTKVEFGNNYHISSLIITNQENKLSLIGFYSEENVRGIKGALFFNVDSENMTVAEGKSFNLPETVYKDLYTEAKSDRKKDDELSRFYVDYVIQDENGETYILAEEFFITTVYVSNGMGGGYMQTVYHYNTILVLKLNANGDLEWGRSIFKRDEFPSYNAFLKNGELHVILNSGKNLTDKEDGRVKVSKGLFESTSLYDIVYNSKGDVAYNKIQDNKNNNYYIPFYGIFSDERFVMISSGAGKKQFLILE